VFPCLFADMTEQAEKFLVFAGMRNEGPFIVEWVSWYRMLGFEVLIGINDCTDHSPALLRRLAEEGWCQVFEHHLRVGSSPKVSAHRAMRKHPAVAATDWLLICDVDEFLVLRQGDGTIGSFLDRMGRGFLGMAFHWKCFGNGGHKTYADGLVHEQFLTCGPGQRGPNAMFKTLIHKPLRFRRYSDHSPFEFDGTWGALPDNIVDSEGRPIMRFLTDEQPIRFTETEDITHKNAQMNHYVIRADESFDLKRGTKSATAMKDRYTEHFYRQRNRNEKRDLSALSYRDRFAPFYAATMALPGVRRLHHLCCADYVVRLCAKQGRRAEDDRRWQTHIAAAEGA
jgi:hypothetical protein